MSLPTCEQLVQAAERAEELALYLGGTAAVVCESPEDDHVALLQEAKMRALTDAALIVYDMEVDIACYPISHNTAIYFDVVP